MDSLNDKRSLIPWGTNLLILKINFLFYILKVLKPDKFVFHLCDSKCFTCPPTQYNSFFRN